MKIWEEYQEDVASFFRGLGLCAETNVKVSGVRSSSDVDVLAKTTVYGFEVTWVIECKQWSEAVNKLHVFALRQIVSDLGADRGILLCEKGFQGGAVEAANFTNIQLSSLAELKVLSRNTISNLRLQQMFDRSVACKDRYWEVPKSVRIAAKLRPEAAGYSNYSGDRVCEFLIKYTAIAMRNIYPIQVAYFDTVLLGKHSLLHFDDQSARQKMNLALTIGSSPDAVAFLEPILIELEEGLERAESMWRSNGENSRSGDSIT